MTTCGRIGGPTWSDLLSFQNEPPCKGVSDRGQEDTQDMSHEQEDVEDEDDYEDDQEEE